MSDTKDREIARLRRQIDKLQNENRATCVTIDDIHRALMIARAVKIDDWEDWSVHEFVVFVLTVIVDEYCVNDNQCPTCGQKLLHPF